MAEQDPEIGDWINYQLQFDTTEEKVRFLLYFEKWVRKWQRAGWLASFHTKHHRSPKVVRIRLLPTSSSLQSIAEEMKASLSEYDHDIISSSREIRREEDDMSIHDIIRWKVMEFNTEILLLLLKKYGSSYKQNLKEKYLADKFDMIHLLLNQLGLPEVENWSEIRKLDLWYEEQFKRIS
jgi:hypothetical protein